MFKLLIDVTMKPISVMINCKRKMIYQRNYLPHEYFVKYPEYFKAIKKFCIDSRLSKEVLMDNQYIFRIPEKKILEMYKLCTKLKVNLKTLPKNPKMLTFSLEKVEHRIMQLEEMGVHNIHAALLSHYGRILHMRVSLFKAGVKMEDSVNVAENLIKHIGPLPPGVPPLEPLSDDLSVRQYLKQFLRWYLRWRLNLSKYGEIMMEESLHSLKNRSYRVMKKQIDLLHDDIGLTGDKIMQKRCLTAGSSEELNKIISTVKTFGGIDIKKLIRVKPTLHKMNYNNVIEVIKIIEKHGFTDKMIRLYPEIFVMPHEILTKKLNIIDDTLELKILKNNWRVLTLLPVMTTVMARLEYLLHHNVKSVTIRCLTGGRRYFDAIIRSGVDRTNGREIGFAFAKMMKLDRKEITRRIRKHPYWRRVAIVSMNDTAKYLLEHFSPEDIHDSIQLILYPRQKIDEILKSLPEMNEKSQEKRRSRKEILALCLYEIEREYHFTGDGIWLHEIPAPQARIFSEHIEAELTDSSDMDFEEVDQPTDKKCNELKRRSVHKKINKQIVI